MKPPEKKFDEIVGEIAQWITLDKNDFVLDEPAQVSKTFLFNKRFFQSGFFLINSNNFYTSCYQNRKSFY